MKIVTKNISIQEPKKFYYIVYDAQDVHDLNIYLMSETVSKYQVAVKVVDDVTYAKDTNNSAYGKFN
jgi:hypothetical protein